MFGKFRFAAPVAPLSLVFLAFAQGALSGCGSSAAPRASASPSDEAASFKLARCSGFGEDGAVADVLDGKAVEGVTPLYSGGGSSKTNNPRLLGAVVYVRPAAGETAEWLNRALECHARRAGDRTAALRAASDPFFLPGSRVRIHIQPAGDSFRVDIEGASSADAREILSRASAFASASGAAQGLAAQPELP